MRIILFFILVFTSLWASAQEEPPTYWGQTGLAVKANYMEHINSLKWFVYPNEATEPDFRKFRKYIYEKYEKAYPRIQLMLLLREQLGEIALGYAIENRSDVNDKIFYYLADQIEKKTGAFSDEKVLFEYDTKGRFQVDGIDPNRLGINTGQEIYFNVAGILKKETWAAPEIVQLWLHEILHGAKDISLEDRDAWTAKVAQWVRARTTEIALSESRKVMTLRLPNLDQGRPMRWGDLKPQKHFLAYETTPKESRIMTELYEGFATFGNFLNSYHPQSVSDSNVTLWPVISVSSVRKTSRGSIQIEYSQESVYYDQGMQSAVYESFEGIGYDGRHRPPVELFRLDWNPETGASEISRAYSNPLAPDDFEIYNVKDVGQKRFVSLRVKTQDMKSLLAAKNLHVLARNNFDGRLLSFEVMQKRAVNKQELLIHLQVPQSAMEISQILLPDTQSERYREIAIRPSNPARLQGNDSGSSAPKNVQSVAIKERQSDNEKTAIELKVKSEAHIKGISFDLEHRLSGFRYRLENGNVGSEYKTDFGTGRKYYMRRSQFKIRNGKIQFKIPMANLTKYQAGPRLHVMFGTPLSYESQENLAYIRDNLERKISALWVHYDDGSIEKVPYDLLPKDFVSLESHSQREERADTKKSRGQRMWEAQQAGYFDMSLLDDAIEDEPDTRPEPVSCEGIF